MKTEIYKRIYDDPKFKDWTEKQNELLWIVDINDNQEMSGYDYVVYGMMEWFAVKVTGQEISYNNWWIMHKIQKLIDCNDVKEYIRLSQTN